VEINFGIQSYRHGQARQLSSQRLINGYAEVQKDGAKSRIAVFGFPGVSLFGTAGTGPFRGGIVIAGVPYVVSGTQLYSIGSDGSAQLRGAGITGIDRISIDSSLTEVIIVNTVNGFSYQIETEDFVQISDADFREAATVTSINNLFVFDEIDTNRFQVSNVLDGRAYDLDFATAESNPDKVLAVKNRNGTLLVLGETTTEYWDHTGATDFPFARFKGGTLDRGIRAVHAVVNEDQSTFMLGNDLVAYRMSGSGLQRISDHALETLWQSYDTTSDAFMFSVPINGHKFINLTFPTQNATFTYDIATGMWHDRVSYDPEGTEVKWRVGGALSAYDRILVGDLNSGRIGVLDSQVYTEFGDPMIFTAVSAPLYAKGKRIFVPRLELDMEVGVGLTSGQGSDPQVMMSYSTDGGKTFSAPVQPVGMGQIGEYTTRLVWDRLGSAYQFVFKFSISDPVLRVITGARCPGAFTGD
jgi:hypothetical protein